MQPNTSTLRSHKIKPRTGESFLLIDMTDAFFVLMVMLSISQMLIAYDHVRTLGKYVSFSLSTTATVLVIVVGAVNFGKANINGNAKAVFLLYISYLVAHSVFWLTGPHLGVATWFVNPIFSIPSWLFVFMVPFASMVDVRRLGFLYRKNTILILMTSAILLAGFSTKSSGIMNIIPIILLLVFIVLTSRRKTLPLPWGLTILVVCAGIMLLDEYRSCFLACVLAAALYVVQFPSKIFRTAIVCLILASTAIYLQYSAQIFGSGNSALPHIFQDTRSFAIQEFFSQYQNDGGLKDLLVGKGFGGTFFSNFFYYYNKNGGMGGDYALRSSIEIGYLHLVLKIGILGLVLLFLLMVSPIVWVRIERGEYFKAGCIKMLLVFLLFYFSEFFNTAGFGYGLWYSCAGFVYGLVCRDLALRERRLRPAKSFV